jgi:hypothetical protein
MCVCCGIAEIGVITGVCLVPIALTRLWRKIRVWLAPDPWVVFDYYHDRLLFTWPDPQWFATKAEAEAVAKHAAGESGHNRYEVIRLKRERTPKCSR